MCQPVQSARIVAVACAAAAGRNSSPRVRAARVRVRRIRAPPSGCCLLRVGGGVAWRGSASASVGSTPRLSLYVSTVLRAHLAVQQELRTEDDGHATEQE